MRFSEMPYARPDLAAVKQQFADLLARFKAAATYAEAHAVFLEEKGYNPINQLVGYILSEDPTYITTYKNARAIIRRIDRDDLLQALVRDFVKH